MGWVLLVIVGLIVFWRIATKKKRLFNKYCDAALFSSNLGMDLALKDFTKRYGLNEFNKMYKAKHHCDFVPKHKVDEFIKNFEAEYGYGSIKR